MFVVSSHPKYVAATNAQLFNYQLSTDFESDVPLKNIEKHLERLQTVFVSDVADGHSL